MLLLLQFLLLLLLMSLLHLHLWLRTWRSGNCIGASLAGLAINSMNSGYNKRQFGESKGDAWDTIKNEIGTRPSKKNSSRISVLKPRPSFKYFYWPFDPKQVVDCTNCYLKGQIQFGGHLKVGDFVSQQAWWTVLPEGLEEKLEINLRIKAQEGHRWLFPMIFWKWDFLVSWSHTSSTLGQTLSMKSGYWLILIKTSISRFCPMRLCWRVQKGRENRKGEVPTPAESR